MAQQTNKKESKRRRTIPGKIADEVMFAADLLCSVCENRGDQIHHIDKDPSNNEIDNLILLCFKHHDEVTVGKGLARRLTPSLLRRYRISLLRKVEAKRGLPSIEPKNPKLDDAHYFQLMHDAVSIGEIHKIMRRLDVDNDEDTLTAIYDLGSYVDSGGLRARREILDRVDDVASGLSRPGASQDIARAVARVTYDALPIRNLRFPTKTQLSEAETELMEYGLAIGSTLAYQGALYVRDIKFVDAGGELLWKVLRYARINNYSHLRERALDEFETAQDGAERSGDNNASELIQLYRDHALSGDWRNPIYGERLLRLITL